MREFRIRFDRGIFVCAWITEWIRANEARSSVCVSPHQLSSAYLVFFCLSASLRVMRIGVTSNYHLSLRDTLCCVFVIDRFINGKSIVSNRIVFSSTYLASANDRLPRVCGRCALACNAIQLLGRLSVLYVNRLIKLHEYRC